MTSSIHATRPLVPSRADLLPSRKRFGYSISPEDSVEEESDTNMLEDIEADATVVEVQLPHLSGVALRSSSPTTSTLEILTAPILPAPSAIVAPSFEFPLAPVVAPSGIYR
uniref:Uncharacterized protein n=1 Tax=Tanacetum cinerariifolium TaxID=118510 RepID=A0A699KT16_TANCI|nr:hypothetical protein [Tanacetum cinerariifolium]